jgi:hypothetical protein
MNKQRVTDPAYTMQNKRRGLQMPIEDLIFSGGGGFLFGVLPGYAIKY